jgi:hypothetical protein
VFGILTDLFNQITNKTKFSPQWKTTVICPMYKGNGCKDGSGNYRRISLLSVLGKIFSEILTGWQTG